MMSRVINAFLKPCVPTVGLVLGVVLTGSVSANLLWADQPLPMATIGYQNGKITTVYQTNFLIDGRAYRLAPDVVIYDDSGNRIDAGYISVGLEVKFHVKKEQTDMIDALVLTLPR